MSSAPKHNTMTPKALGIETGASRYDMVSSLMVALVVLIGFVALLLFLIWLTQVIKFSPKKIEIEVIPELMGNNNNPEGLEEDFEEPGVEELPDVQEPQMADALEAVTDAVSTQRAAIEAIDGNVQEMGQGRGVGDRRDPGPGNGGNSNLVPEWERWQIRYSQKSPTEYGKQLDFFKIELGALSRDTSAISYATNLGASPKSRQGRRNIEKRIYFSYGDGNPLQKWDNDLLTAAGVATKGRILVQFYSIEARSSLLTKELAYMKSQGQDNLENVLRTTFGVRSAGSGFEYYVIDMTFR